jgi:site-specific DNA-methyltransferase (adenine-specific)
VTLYLRDPDVELHVGDAFDVLRSLPESSCDCVITSPPYWGLRDYGVEGQIGLEDSPQAYIANLVELFAEIWRVLAPWGTVWLNMGDSYSEKKLGMIPHRLALALQDWGWWVRMDNVWSKRNPLPESVTDRPTLAHEYVFQLARSGKSVYWTHPFQSSLVDKRPEPDYWWFPPAGDTNDPVSDSAISDRQRRHFVKADWKRANAWQGHDYFFDQEAGREPAEWARWGDQTTPKANGTDQKTKADLIRPRSKRELSGGRQARRYDDNEFKTTDERNTRFQGPNPDSQRNMRSVWDIASQPYPDAHFATFPEELVRKALVVACPERVCLQCGMPAERDGACAHSDWRPGIVLDPFMGSGTVAYVARRFARHAIGIELNPDYCQLISARLTQLALPFALT